MFLGYNFLSDQDSLTPSYNTVGKINKIEASKIILDELLINNVVKPFNKSREDWTFLTLFLAKFKGNTSAGNIDFAGLLISVLRVKRRKIEEISNWMTIRDIPYTEDQVEIYDSLNESSQEYEYAIVPVMDNGNEGDYNNNKILSEFDSAFILDINSSYKLSCDLEYGTKTRNISSSVYKPLGSRFPIIVKNGDMYYDTGSVTALVVSQQTIDESVITDRKVEIKLRNQLEDFLSSGTSKILKDSNGNMWIIGIAESPSTTYLNETKQALARCSFNWTEMGDANNQEDLYDLGLVDILI
ncbi:hypothetical protein G9F71_008235 [Clostridium sp. FP2]|uniref:hypothetical protein n=1 Tax=Clostridium sp. FP2 TaxID=2724481 RepID=UPI0013E910DA|nr:hypothetical protein [Clostridium sp. FP2]MBZ9622839.1 hypothetical protein [Clostridium sp. FP2]